MSSRAGAGYRRGEAHPDYRRWIVTGVEPKCKRLVTPPVPATAHVLLYDGSVEDVDVQVIAQAPGSVCVEQRVEDRGIPRTWLAWVDADHVRRRTQAELRQS